jgi:uncharacterized protein with von Willebrand factor type A (vWA) domain
VRQPDEILLGFTRALRSAGVGVTPDRATAFLSATSLVGAGGTAGTYTAGRATLCSGPDDLERYDHVFEAWFAGRDDLPRTVPRGTPRTVRSTLPLGDPGERGGDAESEPVATVASDVEILRHRDVAGTTADEKALLDHLIATLRPRAPRRRATRRTPARRGEVDLHRTLRRSLRSFGEPARIAHRRRAHQPRRVVLLVDVSASMRAYDDALLRLAHRIAGAVPDTETFTLGTRLTRITTALRTRDADRALVRAGEQVPDWSGGTRLGETLGAFLERWGARGMARGAVVVVFSDGWEQGDTTELGVQVQRLARLAHRVVWVNPHRGKAGYEPVQRGIVTVLPHCDDFVAGHSVRSFERVLDVIADA